MPRAQRIKDLGYRQRRILQYLLETIEERGYPPSVREIADNVGLASPSTVHAHLEALERKGYLSKDPTKPRAIEIHFAPDVGPVPKRSGVRHVPLVGRIAAGSPDQAIEEVEDVLPLPTSVVGEGTLFMLRVKGDSMTGIGIHPGDCVVVRKQEDAAHGDVVAALVGDDATVKTLIRENGDVYLRPENPAHPNIPVDEGTSVLGVVVALLRSF